MAYLYNVGNKIFDINPHFTVGLLSKIAQPSKMRLFEIKISTVTKGKRSYTINI